MQRTFMSSSTPVQPLKATVGSGDTWSILREVGGGRGVEGWFVLLRAVSSIPVQPLKATVVSEEGHRLESGVGGGRGLCVGGF